MTPVVEWQGCYDAGWKGLIGEAAFAHPAKMARGLVARIFDELFEMGTLKIVLQKAGGKEGQS